MDIKTGGVSIVIPTKGREEDLRRCVSSLLHQLDTRDEIIIVNGGQDLEDSDI